MGMDQSCKRGAVVYLSHGGGPQPIRGGEGHKAMIAFMKELPEKLDRPDAVLVVSAHWEEQVPTLLGHPSPGMLYDYYGFPPEAYELIYPAPGHPGLAGKIAGLLQTAGIPSAIDRERGFDHGLFVPLKLMYPDADIPMLQLSLVRGLDAGTHIALGKALRSLREENVLVIGSGFSFHNMRAFTWNGTNRPDPDNDAFQDWLIEVCSGTHAFEEREQMLLEWEKAPQARYCHPREEHLLPLHVCFGLSDGPAEVIFDDYIVGKRSVAFRW